LSSAPAPLTWTIFEAIDTDGVAIVGRFDHSFRDVAKRAGRSTLVMAQFYGPYMIKSGENRGDFEDSPAAFLGEHDGVLQRATAGWLSRRSGMRSAARASHNRNAEQVR
jgi:hypothetical protein